MVYVINMLITCSFEAKVKILMPKKRKKIKPEQSLQFSHFPKEYEAKNRKIYELACCSANRLGAIDISSKESRNLFLSVAHNGMRLAQDEIIERIQCTVQPDKLELLLLRGIADAIAWQILGYQLCYARRLFIGQMPPDLYNCNLDSAIFVARAQAEEDLDSIPLISDLTSFVQVGDILKYDSHKGVSINEIKEGKKNQYLLEFMELLIEAKCDYPFYHFMKTEDESTIKQFERMVRQHERMHHVSDAISGKRSIDPDTGNSVNIPNETIEVAYWFENLQLLCEQTNAKSWAIDVVDGCLFLGCYSEPPMIYGGHIMFWEWFKNCGGNEQCPVGTMIDSMKAPLALPVYNWFIKDDYKFDLLFGRKHLCIGINIEALLEQCRNNGIGVRWATNKETTQMQQLGVKPYKYKGKAIFLSYGSNETALFDGIFMRIMFHAQKPISTLKAILSQPIDYYTGNK